MHLSNYEVFLQGQCASCSQTLKEADDKVLKIRTEQQKNVGDCYDTPYSLEQDITNFEAIALMYGMSHRTLVDKLVEYFESEEITSEERLSTATVNQNLTFCNECGPLFAEMFRSVRKFMNLVGTNSLLSKILPEKFCKINDSQLQVIGQDDWEMKVESENEDFEEDPSEDPLMIDNNSTEGVNDSQFENITEECNSDNWDLNFDNQNVIDTGCSSANLVHGKGRYSLRKCKTTEVINAEQASDDNETFSEGDSTITKLPKKGYHIVKKVNKLKGKSRNCNNYVCNECGSQFSSLQTMRIHLVSHIQEKDLSIYSEPIKGPPYSCPTCDKKFKWRIQLKLHCAESHNLRLVNKWSVKSSQPKSCSECGSTHNGIRGLEIHLRIAHSLKIYSCYECDEGFPMEIEWIAHSKDFHPGTTNSNEPGGDGKTTDDSQSRRIASMKRRIKINRAKEGSFKNSQKKIRRRKQDLSNQRTDCSVVLDKLPEDITAETICNLVSELSHEKVDDDSVKGRYSLRTSNTTKGIKVEQTSDDNTHFSNGDKSCLETPKRGYHIVREVRRLKRNNNTQEIKSQKHNNYVCNECGSRFSSLQTMQIHLVSHIQEKDQLIYSETIKGPPYPCPKCDQKFKWRITLKLHCAESHNLRLVNKWSGKSIKPKSCSECGCTYNGIKGLEIHLRTVHGLKMYTCYQCDEGFPGEAAWLTHSRDFHTGRTNSDRSGDDGKRTEDSELKRIAVLEKRIKESKAEKISRGIVCNDCGESFTSRKCLRKHEMSCHSVKLRTHQENIQGPPFKCPECENMYTTALELKYHCIKKHYLKTKTCQEQLNPSFSCKECDSMFDDFEAFVTHCQSTHNKNCFPCLACEEIFEDKSKFEVHEKEKHPEGYESLESMVEQENDESHEEGSEICEDPFFCRECGFSFKNFLAITTHNRIHQTIKNFDCSRCPESFNNAMTLLHHLSKVHNVFGRLEIYKDSYWCTDCQDAESFDSVHHLRKHQREFNHSSYNITCAFCETRFENRNDLKVHKKLNHTKFLKTKPAKIKISLKCPFCEKTFRNLKEKADHKLTHPKEERVYKCPDCPKEYATTNSLYSHREMIHTEETFQCHECGQSIDGIKKFRAHCKNHIERASGIKPLCDLCGKTFISKKQLHKHKSLTHLRKEEKHCEICGYVSKTACYFRKHMQVHEKNGTPKPRKKKWYM